MLTSLYARTIQIENLLLEIFCSDISLVCFLVFLLQGCLSLLQDGGDLPLHEGPGHVGARERAALPTGAEDLIVSPLFLDGLS